MADWQERVQAMIMGFVFAYMVMKLFAVVANFRAGNMRVERASDADTLLASTSEAEVETETEAEPGRENSASSSSSSSDEEEEEEDAAAKPVVESKDAAVEDEAKLPEESTVEPASTLKVESEEETVGGAFEEEEEAGDEDWEDVESTELEKRFGAASTFADDTVMVNNPELHALYKLATEGPCSSSQPSAFQPTARAKWNAWQKLGSMSQEEAMQKYIHLVTAINPNWYQDDRKGKEATQQQADVSPSSGGGASASSA